MKTFPVQEKSDETARRHIKAEIGEAAQNGQGEKACGKGEAEENIQRDADGPHLFQREPHE